MSDSSPDLDIVSGFLLFSVRTYMIEWPTIYFTRGPYVVFDAHAPIVRLSGSDFPLDVLLVDTSSICFGLL